MRPCIGIVGELAGEKPELRLSTRYARAVWAAGGLPLAVLPVGDARVVDELLARLDGLVFAGADDFDTAALGLGPVHPRAKPVPREKQEFDFALARAALERELPVLGICYGMQLLGLAEGGTFHQHLPEDRPGKREHSGGVVHTVRVSAGSALRACTGQATLEVVSRHHQALASVAAPWKVAATDDEDLIEAIERDGHPFALGVQWHPELACDPALRPAPRDGAAHGRIFTALVEAARLRARPLVSTDSSP